MQVTPRSHARAWISFSALPNSLSQVPLEPCTCSSNLSLSDEETTLPTRLSRTEREFPLSKSQSLSSFSSSRRTRHDFYRDPLGRYKDLFSLSSPSLRCSPPPLNTQLGSTSRNFATTRLGVTGRNISRRSEEWKGWNRNGNPLKLELKRWANTGANMMVPTKNHPESLESFTPDHIRNFAIIAHIDHGKSTLADRLLELTGTISSYGNLVQNATTDEFPDEENGSSRGGTTKQINKQVLDKLKVERERGITVKAMTASMIYSPSSSSSVSPNNKSQSYLLNLLDTPGHVDFSTEVARSLLACQGCLLLVDASQGIQAQTLSVLSMAMAKKLTIIPILNKCDLPHAEPDKVEEEVRNLIETDLLDQSGLSSQMGEDPTYEIGEVLKISAKTGMGIGKVLKAIVDRIPPPPPPPPRVSTPEAKNAIAIGEEGKRLKALVFDNYYDVYRGVVSLIALVDGRVKKGDFITSAHSGKKYEIQDVGFLHPEEVSLRSGLGRGQVGWMTCNMKDSSEAILGDTFFCTGHPVEPLEPFKQQKAMVFSGVYPVDSSQFTKLDESIRRLTLTDRSVTIQRETSAALGQGFRLGFLGSLHNDVFRQRLEDEYDAEVVITRPFVPVKIITQKGDKKIIDNPSDFPEPSEMSTKKITVEEPMIKATIILPDEYLGPIMELCLAHRATDLDQSYFSSANSSRLTLTCFLPLSSVVTTFHSSLKSSSSGFASFDYEEAEWQKSDLSKMHILVNGRKVEELASVVHASEIQREAKKWTAKMKDVIPRQQYEVIIQAAVGAKIITRERIAPVRKDVTAGLYGGHYERKLKQLEKQKAGKKRLRRVGNVEIPSEAFHKILQNT